MEKQIINKEVLIGNNIGVIDADMIKEYLNECNPEVHFIDVFLDGEYLEQYDIKNSGFEHYFYLAWFMEGYKYIGLEKFDIGLKFILEGKEVLEFKATNKYYL